MCVSINDERAARRYVAELVRSGQLSWARRAVAVYQVSYDWLMDLDRVTCERKAPTPRRPSVQPGMKQIRKAIREALKTMPPVVHKTKATV
jgi:hypothetical protein